MVKPYDKKGVKRSSLTIAICVLSAQILPLGRERLPSDTIVDDGNSVESGS